jgi:hypothetical protein
MEALEVRKDHDLQMIHKSQPTTYFWKLVPETEYRQIK